MTTDWHARWEEGRIGFHREEVNPWLTKFLEHIVHEDKRLLVPMCGKSLDMTFLAEHAHEVVGIELVEKAVIEFFAEKNVAATVEEGPHRIYRHGRVELHVADVLDSPLEPYGTFDAIWDRAALIALPKIVRAQYAGRLLQMLKPGGHMLLVSLSYDQTKLDGPPYSVTDEEVQELYADAGELVRLHSESAGDAPAKFEELGLELVESVWKLTRS
jgi:thiopurine S-methyltransferase